MANNYIVLILLVREIPLTDLDLSALKSSPPNGTELRTATIVFNSAPASNEHLISPIRRYATRVTQLLERQNTELVVIKKELEDQTGILKRRNTNGEGKRIKFQVRRMGSQLQKGHVNDQLSDQELEEEEEGEVVLNSSASSDTELEEVTASRIRSKRQG